MCPYLSSIKKLLIIHTNSFGRCLRFSDRDGRFSGLDWPANCCIKRRRNSLRRLGWLTTSWLVQRSVHSIRAICNLQCGHCLKLLLSGTRHPPHPVCPMNHGMNHTVWWTSRGLSVRWRVYRLDSASVTLACAWRIWLALYRVRY